MKRCGAGATSNQWLYRLKESARVKRVGAAVAPLRPCRMRHPTASVSLMTPVSSPRRSLTTSTTNGSSSDDISTGVASASGSGGGAGLQNVRDRVMLTARRSADDLYRYTLSQPKTCTVIGAPMTYGQPYVGTDVGPTLLREAGLRQHLSALSWRVQDLADLDFSNLPTTSDSASSGNGSYDNDTATTAAQKDHGNTTTNNNNINTSFLQPIAPDNAKNRWQVSAGTRLLAATVERTIQQGNFPLILGGDHSVGIGSLAAILRAHPDTGVVWIDAHADINTPAISESGNMHGMPVGLLMQGIIDSSQYTVPAFEWLRDYPKMKPHQLVYVGLRDVDVEERKIINDLGIVAYTMTDIDRYGIGKVMELAVDHHLAGRRLHVSYDIDAIDPVLAPATGTRVRGGLTFREAMYVAEALAATGRLASAELVELNPTLSNVEGANLTVELGLQIITSLMGKSII